MVTVATKLDVPIKLVFQGPSRSSILGLGDIVVPGIFIALALRFDLWKHYERQITSVPTELKAEFADETSAKTVTTTQTQQRQVKVPFVDPRGRWGDRMWSARNLVNVFSAPTATPALAATSFSKPYFYASMTGYALGMLLTLAMMLMFKHGQPALLYLVPCVAGAVWLTGAVRGEIRDMLTYTEDGTLDTKEVVVEVDGSGRTIEEKSDKAAKRGEQNEGSTDEAPNGAEGSSTSEAADQPKEQGSREDSAALNSDGSYDVFVFSITAPGQASLKVD
jgi:minor histocompatibility antigen H13